MQRVIQRAIKLRKAIIWYNADANKNGYVSYMIQLGDVIWRVYTTRYSDVPQPIHSDYTKAADQILQLKMNIAARVSVDRMFASGFSRDGNKFMEIYKQCR